MKKTRIYDAGLGPGASSFDLMTAEERELLGKIRNKKHHIQTKYLVDPFFSETAKDASL